MDKKCPKKVSKKHKKTLKKHKKKLKMNTKAQKNLKIRKHKKNKKY